MKINKHDMLTLQKLLLDGVTTEAKFNNSDIVTALKQNGSVKSGKKGVKVRYIELVKAENVFSFLNHYNYNIKSTKDIENYIVDLYNNSSISRDLIQKHTSNTKAKKSASLEGLYVAALEDVEIKIDDEVVTLSAQNGMGYFLFHSRRVTLDKDTVIVGVENYEVVWFAKKYRKFFKSKNILFVMINPYMLKWIEEVENEYIHFGDYDLDGINIYLNKVVPHLKRSQKHSFFIPQNIERLLQERGNALLYKQQIRLENLTTSDREIERLIKIIKREKKGIEQEGLYLF